MGKLSKKSNFVMLLVAILLINTCFMPTTSADKPHVWLEQDIMNFGYVERGECKGPWDLVVHNEGPESATVTVSLQVSTFYDDSDYEDLNQFKLNGVRNGGVTLTLEEGEQRSIDCEYCPREGVGDGVSIVLVVISGYIDETNPSSLSCVLMGETSPGPYIPFSVKLDALTWEYVDGVPTNLPPRARNFKATITEGKPPYDVEFNFGDGERSTPLTTSYKEVSKVHYYDQNDRYYTASVTVWDKNGKRVRDTTTVHIYYLEPFSLGSRWFPTKKEVSYIEGTYPDLYPPISSDEYEYSPAFIEQPIFSSNWRRDDFWTHGIRYREDYESEYLVPDEFNFFSSNDPEGHGNFKTVWYPDDFIDNPWGFESSPMVCQSFKPDCNRIGAFALRVGRAASASTGFTIGLYPQTDWIKTNEIDENGHKIWERRPDVLNPLAEIHYSPDEMDGHVRNIGGVRFWEGISWHGLTYQDGRDLKRNPDGFIYFSENSISSKMGYGTKSIKVTPGQTYYIGITLDSCPDRSCFDGIFYYGTGAFGADQYYSKGCMGKMDLYDWDSSYHNPVRYKESTGKDLCFYVWGWDEPPNKPINHAPENGATVKLFEYGSDSPNDSPFSAISPMDGKEGVWLSAGISDPDYEDQFLEVLFYGALDPNNEYRKPEDLIKEENLIGKSGVSKYVRQLSYPEPCTVRKFWPDLVYAGDIPYKWTVVVRDWGMQRTNKADHISSPPTTSYVDAASMVQHFYTSPTGEHPDDPTDDISAEVVKLVQRPFDEEWYEEIDTVVDERVTFKIIVANTGKESIDIELKDILPDEFEYLNNANIQPNIIDTELSWEFFDISADSEPIQIIFDVEAKFAGTYENWVHCLISESDNSNSDEIEYSDSVIVNVFEYPDFNEDDDKFITEPVGSEEQQEDHNDDSQNDEETNSKWSRITDLFKLFIHGRIQVPDLISLILQILLS